METREGPGPMNFVRTKNGKVGPRKNCKLLAPNHYQIFFKKKILGFFKSSLPKVSKKKYWILLNRYINRILIGPTIKLYSFS